MSRRRRKQGLATIFAWPALLTLMTAAGLGAGLLGDGGAWDMIAWAGIGLPLLALRPSLSKPGKAPRARGRAAMRAGGMVSPANRSAATTPLSRGERMGYRRRRGAASTGSRST